MLIAKESSQTELNRLDFRKSVAVIPAAPLERHGPHLPVGTDLIIAEQLSVRLAGRIERRFNDIQAVLYPSVPLGSHVVSGPGSTSVRQNIFQGVLFDILRSLSRTGFRFAVIVSSHGGIGNIVAVEEAAEQARRELGMRVEPALSAVIVPFVTGRFLKEIEAVCPLGPEDRRLLASDIHGGQWETGFILTERPDLVADDYAELPDILFSGWLSLREIMAKSCAQGLGYVGAPSRTSLEYTAAATEVLVQKLEQRVHALLYDRRFRPSHTPFYYWPAYRSKRLYSSAQVKRAAALSLTLGCAIGFLARAGQSRPIGRSVAGAEDVPSVERIEE